MNEMKLTHENEVFDTMMKNFDLMMERTIGNMIMRNADESTVTLKIAITLDRKSVPADGGGFRETIQPTFKHDLSSVMQVKDKMSGTFKGNVELIFDENGKPIVRDIEDGQMKIWDENGNISVAEDTDEDANLRALPAGKLGIPETTAIEAEYTENDEPDEKANTEKTPTPYDWLMQYRNQYMRVNEQAGTFTVRAETDQRVILSSGFMKDSPFYIDPWKLQQHEGHKLICVTSPENADAEEAAAIEIWCEDCGTFLFEILNPDKVTEDAPTPAPEDEDSYTYDEPESEETEK